MLIKLFCQKYQSLLCKWFFIFWCEFSNRLVHCETDSHWAESEGNLGLAGQYFQWCSCYNVWSQVIGGTSTTFPLHRQFIIIDTTDSTRHYINLKFLSVGVLKLCQTDRSRPVGTETDLTFHFFFVDFWKKFLESLA